MHKIIFGMMCAFDYGIFHGGTLAAARRHQATTFPAKKLLITDVPKRFLLIGLKTVRRTLESAHADRSHDLL